MKKKRITRSLLVVFFALQLVSCSSEYVKMDADSCDCFQSDPGLEYDYETKKMKYNGEIFSGIVCEEDRYSIEEITQYEEGKRTIVSEFEIDKGIDPWLSEYTEYKNAMFSKTDTKASPWKIIRANRKTEARVNVINHILESIPYDKDLEI